MGSRGREMRRLADDIIGGVKLPVPVTPEALFAALVEIVQERRGRPVVLCEEVFPPHTASGLWLELETHDIIVVEKRAAPWHQLVIFFHEVWHMLKGDCGLHIAGASVAARVLDRADDPRAAATAVAARSDFATHAEQNAERFGLLMGRRLRTWLQTAPPAAGDGSPGGIATRIEAALAYRGPRT